MVVPVKKKMTPTVRVPADQFQQEAARVIEGINSRELVTGVLLEGVALTTTGVRVNHNLGRPMKGFLLVDCTVYVNIKRSGESTNNFVTLASDVNATVSLWVF